MHWRPKGHASVESSLHETAFVLSVGPCEPHASGMNSTRDHQPVAIVLGGTSPHAELCRLLKARGYHTLLIDYYERPCAKAAADEHLRVSTLDQERVLEIARNRAASLVLATCIDQANVTACYVLERLGKFAPYSYQTAVAVSTKSIMKAIMIKHGIPTSRFVQVSDTASTHWRGLNFPLIVKPCDSNSSKGVRRCDSPEQVERHLASALGISRRHEAVVEEFKDGREIAFDSYVMNGRVHLMMTRERRKITGFRDSIQQIYGSFWPAHVSGPTQQRLVAVGEWIARVFQLDNTPLMMQAIISGDQISVIEFAPRIGGGENHRIIKMATGFDLIDAAIDSFLGRRPVLNQREPGRVFLDNYLYAKPCLLGRVEGMEELLQDGVIDCFETYKSTGFEVGESISSNNRVGAFIVSGASEQECLETLRRAVSRVEIFDCAGNPVMLREIYD
ncbi:MAG: argininosuccinate lyase [Verrucomicrobia bacterium ADurb.Bin006]|nr:MAG: argininosuccinate lyase [Verrucomicrobia bacterium ADurb.Bin006]